MGEKIRGGCPFSRVAQNGDTTERWVRASAARGPATSAGKRAAAERPRGVPRFFAPPFRKCYTLSASYSSGGALSHRRGCSLSARLDATALWVASYPSLACDDPL